ncbi:MAG: single-stranded DNA-binding protein [Clostridia bacterium]|nr:single-stranded DNA-binding protein [Clostridia bacterium]
MNSLILEGRVVNSPRFTRKNGNEKGSFNLEVVRNRYLPGEEGETLSKTTSVDFPKVVFFKELAIILEHECIVDRVVRVEGWVHTSTVIRDEQVHYKTELIAEKITIIKSEEVSNESL